MKRLNTKERTLLRMVGDEVLRLRSDWPRRLRNALVALAQLDPGWMIWVEKEIDPEATTLQEITRRVERRARVFLLKRYGYFGNQEIGQLICRDDWPFTDLGALSTG